MERFESDYYDKVNFKEINENVENVDKSKKLGAYKKLHNKIIELVNAVDTTFLDKRKKTYHINKDSKERSGLNTPDKFTKSVELAYKQLDNWNQENLNEFMKIFIPMLNDLVTTLKENNETLKGWLTIAKNKEKFDEIITNIEKRVFKPIE